MICKKKEQNIYGAVKAVDFLEKDILLGGFLITLR